MGASKVGSHSNYCQINKEELVKAFGDQVFNTEIVKDHWTQGFRKIVHGIGQLFGARIYGKVILNNDPSSVIYINKCHLHKITLDSGINWKGPQFVETFVAYVRSKNPQEPVGDDLSKQAPQQDRSITGKPTEDNSGKDSPVDVNKNRVFDKQAQEKQLEEQFYENLYENVSGFSPDDLKSPEVVESRVKIIEEGVLQQQDEVSKKAALSQVFRDPEKIKNLLSFYCWRVKNQTLEELQPLMTDDQKMFLLSLVMSVTQDVRGKKEMDDLLSFRASQLFNYFQKDSSRVERAISTEMGAYALKKIRDASRYITLSTWFQEALHKVLANLKE